MSQLIGDDDKIMKLYGYPPALAKACVDHFEYLIKLKDGQLIFFNDAKPIDRDWVHIDVSDTCSSEWNVTNIQKTEVGFNFERGLDLRVSDISWVADAPRGS